MTPKYGVRHIGLVVEGAGDAEAVPLLLRRHLHEIGIFDDLLGSPVRCNGIGNATTPSGIEGFIAVAAARPGCQAIMVVLDGEGSPVNTVGPKLLTRCLKVAGHLPIAICLADRSYEDWLYASCETLEIGIDNYKPQTRGQGVIVEALKPAKYVKPTWQPRLTARMDIALARGRSESLNRALEKLETIVANVFPDVVP